MGKPMTVKKEDQKNLGKKLDQIIALLRIIAKRNIDDLKMTILSTRKKEQIFEMCDGTHDIGEIATKVGVSGEYVRLTIKELEEAGFIILEQKGGKRYPVRMV
jgi:DNA-binding transcriptional ArsR family regulator